MARSPPNSFWHGRIEQAKGRRSVNFSEAIVAATASGAAPGKVDSIMGFEGIGASVRRKEDQRFLNGRGNYTDDINRPGQTWASIKRSDRPHAKIRSIDTTAAKAAPGVLAIFVGADMVVEEIGGLPC